MDIGGNRRTQRQFLSNLRLLKNETYSLLAAETSHLFSDTDDPRTTVRETLEELSGEDQDAPKEEESAGVKEIAKELQSIHALPVDDIDNNNNKYELADGSSST